MRRLFVILTLCALVGCGASLASILAQVVTASGTALEVAGLITGWVNRAFADVPNPELEKKVRPFIDAMNATARRLHDASKRADLTRQELEELIEQWKRALDNAVAATAPLGVTYAPPGSALGAAPDGTLRVPRPEEFNLQ